MHIISKILAELKIPYTRLGKCLSDTFDDIVPLALAKEGSLVFCNKPDRSVFKTINDKPNTIMLIEKKWGEENCDALANRNATIFLIDNPRLVVAKVLRLTHPEEDTWGEGIHPTAVVHPEADINPSVSVGPYAIVGRCSIGENSCIGAFTLVKDGAIIGKKVIIREFCHVGGCGFSMVRDDNTRKLLRFPHIGRIILEDEVELFPYVNVDRGGLGDTTIKRGAKIDHYAHIGHNCTVGENAIITARTVMCGGSSIGANSWSGVGVIIKEKVSVGDDVTIGLGSVVLKDVPSGAVMAGNPAKVIRMQNPEQ